MRKNKYLIILAMCMTLLTSVNQPIYANSEITSPVGIAPMYAHILSTMTSLSNASGKASCTATIKGLSSSSNLKVFMYLERYNNGTWTPAGSWSDSKTGSSLTLTKNVSVSSGTYRVKASYYANGENVIKYSASKTF